MIAAYNGYDVIWTEESDSAKRHRRFAAAKESMKTIYDDMNFVQSMLDIVADKYFPIKCFTKSEIKLKELREKINRIRIIISRGKMKAVFFGMTSSGKSALINALLRDNVLPSLFGETTAGFVTVEGTDSSTEHAEVNLDGYAQLITMEEVGKRCNLLNTGEMQCNETTVYWPKLKCALLQNELMIIDCPGTCTKSDTDKQVTKYCEDADIHIFVVNSISSLNQAARDFFHDVARCISKPNVLIVFTWWDQAPLMMSKADQEKVHKQHIDRATKLLKDDLKVVETDEQAAKRIFFTSPVEILKKVKVSLPLQWQARQKEFTRFEDTFKESVSTSAIETKFKGHYEESLHIVNSAKSHLEDMAAVLQESKREKERQLRLLEKEIEAFSEKNEHFVRESLLFVDMSNKRIVEEKSKKVVKEAKQDIQKDVKYDVNDLDENDSTCFQQKLTNVALKRTKEMEETLKSITKYEQDKLKADVEELFQTLFPDFNLIINAEGEHQHVEIDYSDAAEISRRDVSVGFMDRCLGGTRKVLSSAPSTLAAKCGTVLTGVKTVATGGMRLSGATFIGGTITSAVMGGAAVVVGGAIVVGYGVKKGLDWNKQRLENNLREQCADNTARFMESKLDEFQEKCSDVMRRYSDQTIEPYLDVMNKQKRGQEQQQKALINEINQMGKLMVYVEKIMKDLSKPAKKLSVFNEEFLLNKGSLIGLFKDVIKVFSPHSEHKGGADISETD